MKILTLVLTMFLGGSALFAQGLSEQKLVELKDAGIQNPLIVKQIEKDGISFRMDADATIRLKKLGFSEEVLNALLSAGEKKTPPAVEDPVKTLYGQGKYAELCDYLKSQLATNPIDYRLRTILIGSLLKLKEKPAALDELENIKAHSQDPASKPYLERASLLVSSWQKQQDGKNKLIAALQNYSYADADSAVDQLSVSVTQKTVLHMLVDSYAGMYQVALARTERLQNLSYADLKSIDVVKNKITDSEKNYNSLMEEANYFVHGASFYEPCKNPFGSGTAIKNYLNYYVDLVSKLTRVAPLSPEVLDLVFHVALLSSKYDDLQSIGDKILGTLGTIRIPFVDESHNPQESFDLVIDTKLRTLSTQPPVSRHSEVRCPVNPNINWGLIKNAPKAVPFSLSFDQIKGISQKGKIDRTVVDWRSYCALYIDPQGVAPDIALHGVLESTVGPAALLQSTRNLGLYILHVIGNPNMKADLIDLQKATKGGHSFLDSFADTMLIMYGAGAVVAQQKELEAQQRIEQQANWQAMLGHDFSALFDGSVFDGLDKLVESPQ